MAVIPGVSRHTNGAEPKLKVKFEEHGMKMKKETEIITPSYYSVVLEDEVGGQILVEQSAGKHAPRLFLRTPLTMSSIKSRPPPIYIQFGRC